MSILCRTDAASTEPANSGCRTPPVIIKIMIVNYVARHGVFFSRMRSPIGSNALHCCQRYGARANDISIINSGLINKYVRCRYSDELISRACALLELIFIIDHSFNL